MPYISGSAPHSRIDHTIPVSATLVETARQALHSLAADQYTIDEIRDVVADVALELRHALIDAGISPIGADDSYR